MPALGDGWKGGSARASVRGYTTRTGKKVKAHTRKAVRGQAKSASKQILGDVLTRAIFGKGETFLRRLGNEIAAELAKSSKHKGRRR